MRQETLTLTFEVRDAARAHRIVERLGRDRVALGAGPPQPMLFHELGIHFARVVVIDEASTSDFPARVVLESCFDTAASSPREARRAHLARLADQRHPELSELWSCARERLPTQRGEPTVRALERALVPHTAVYQGHVHRDLERIALEARIRDEARACVARLPRGLAPELVYQAVRDHVARAVPELRPFAPPPSLPDAQKRLQLLRRPNRGWVREGLPFVLSGLACLPLSLLLAGLVLARERLDRGYDLQTESESAGPELLTRLAESADCEDFGAQNALTHVVPVRSGRGRSLTLRLSHAYLARVARNYFDYTEQLGGIPSIHFAKWLLIDGGRRLLFLSNYDGSWESCLGDFVDEAALGLNLAWMATEGYPSTRFVQRGGASDEETFKAWARVHQRPTALFYSAYPTRSVAEINDNTWLRHGLHADGPGELSPWLRRIT